MFRWVLVMVSVAVVVVGCANEPLVATGEKPAPTEAWQRVELDEMSTVQRGQLERAVEAKDMMAQTLMEELKGELSAGGPASAVVVCRDMAPIISGFVADEHDLAIGRTSHRLRNPDNTGPVWAARMVEEANPTPGYLVGPEGELGVMLPIKLAAPCLACHGREASMGEDLRAALAESYPEDRALDFSEGDLRGWFWIEVPGES